MASALGFEPRQRDLEALVLPLHYTDMKLAPHLGIDPSILPEATNC